MVYVFNLLGIPLWFGDYVQTLLIARLDNGYQVHLVVGTFGYFLTKVNVAMLWSLSAEIFCPTTHLDNIHSPPYLSLHSDPEVYHHLVHSICLQNLSAL